MWVTLSETAEATRVPIYTLWRWVNDGEVPSAWRTTGGGARRVGDLDAMKTRPGPDATPTGPGASIRVPRATGMVVNPIAIF